MTDLLGQFHELPAVSIAAFSLVAAAGLLMGLAPSSLPLMSFVMGSVAARGAREPGFVSRQGVIFAAGFVLGIATIDAAIGGLFGFAGFIIIRALAGSLAVTNFVIAGLLAAMGLALLRVVHVPWLRVQVRPRAVTSFGGAYALGIPFGLSTCPACTPMVLPVLGAAAATGEAWVGAALLFTFGLARGIPLVVVGAATGAAMHLRRATLWMPRIERAGGVLLLIVAGYFLYQSATYAGLVSPLALPLSNVGLGEKFA